MEGKGRFLAWFLPAVCLFAVGFAFAAPWDLAIDQALYRPTSPLSILMEVVGWTPVCLPALLLAALWSAEGWQGSPRRPLRVATGALLGAALLAVMGNIAHGYMMDRGMATTAADWRGWLLLAVCLLLVGLGTAWVFRQNAGLRHKLRFVALSGSAFLVANQLLINGVKLLWQRTRFDTMAAAGSFADYTPWYQWGNGGSSFPSGHTANACGLLVLLVLLCDMFPRWNRHRKLAYGIGWVYMALMALARMVMGRHFLADTLAAAGLMALLFWGIRSTPLYKKGLLAARNGTPAGPE